MRGSKADARQNLQTSTCDVAKHITRSVSGDESERGGVDAEMEEVAHQDEGKAGHESDRTSARLSCKETLSTLSKSTGHSRPWL